MKPFWGVRFSFFLMAQLTVTQHKAVLVPGF